MATDRNGKPIRVDNLVRIPARGVLVYQVEPFEWSKGEKTEVLNVYPESGEVVYLTGRVIAIEDGDERLAVKVDGVEAAQIIAANRVEVTA